MSWKNIIKTEEKPSGMNNVKGSGVSLEELEEAWNDVKNSIDMEHFGNMGYENMAAIKGENYPKIIKLIRLLKLVRELDDGYYDDDIEDD